MNSPDESIIQFLHWMHKNNIDGVIPFLVMMDGKSNEVPHWTDGDKLYTAYDLIELYKSKKYE